MQDTRATASTRSLSRRHFLHGLGVGVLITGAPGLGSRTAQAREDVRASRFGRLFSELPPFASATAPMQAALLDIGKPGGIMDAHDALPAGPLALIVDPSLSLDNPNAAVAEGPAGTTFMGQFMDHDMTFDTRSRLGIPTKPQSSPNSRTPAFDLDSVYGRGPIADSQLYDPADRAKFKIETGGLFEDLPRAADGTAIIADPRNDENLMIAGLHAAFLLFHNSAVDAVRAAGLTDPDEVFDEARRLVTWHYQWIVLHEILPSFIGQRMVDDILVRGRRFYRPGAQAAAFIPVEFQGAAYRFGHSLVRPSYRANLKGDNGSAFFGMIFDPAGQGQADPVDLRGGAPRPPALHRLADVLRLRRRRGQAPQTDRHSHLDALVPSPARRHRRRHAADLAAAAEPAPPSDVGAAVRPDCRRAPERPDAHGGRPRRARGVRPRPRVEHAPLVLRAEGG